ncbi:MAG: hypothetical protein IJR48_06920, partial [Oscillibacter sp.]|nr:hypothetical protein [Oscillibacter sp.]
MWNAKRVAVAALAALMIAGAVPALASEDASEDATTQQEAVVETTKTARKHRKSVTTESGDAVATDDGETSARPSRKPARQSIGSGDSIDAAKPSRKPARKPATTDTADDGDTTARPSRKPAR